MLLLLLASLVLAAPPEGEAAEAPDEANDPVEGATDEPDTSESVSVPSEDADAPDDVPPFHGPVAVEPPETPRTIAPPPEHTVPLPTVHVPDIAPIVGDSADQRLAAARQRIRERDHEGARILLRQVRDKHPEGAEEATYLMGVTWELDNHPEEAIPLYREALKRWPDGGRQADLRFRLAESWGTAGRPRKAIRLLGRVPTADLTESDLLKMELIRGVWELQAGRNHKGLARLEEALGTAGPEDATFYQAKARAHIAGKMLEDAARLDLKARGERQARQLTGRAELITAAEHQVAAIAPLNEPEWALEGLFLTALAYEQLGDDLIDAPTPRELTPEQAAIYEEQIAQRAGIVRTKAARYYKKGLDLAERLDWRSSRVDKLQGGYDSVVSKLEG